MKRHGWLSRNTCWKSKNKRHSTLLHATPGSAGGGVVHRLSNPPSLSPLPCSRVAIGIRYRLLGSPLNAGISIHPVNSKNRHY